MSVLPDIPAADGLTKPAELISKIAGRAVGREPLNPPILCGFRVDFSPARHGCGAERKTGLSRFSWTPPRSTRPQAEGSEWNPGFSDSAGGPEVLPRRVTFSGSPTREPGSFQTPPSWRRGKRIRL